MSSTTTSSGIHISVSPLACIVLPSDTVIGVTTSRDMNTISYISIDILVLGLSNAIWLDDVVLIEEVSAARVATSEKN